MNLIFNMNNHAKKKKKNQIGSKNLNFVNEDILIKEEAEIDKKIWVKYH